LNQALDQAVGVGRNPAGPLADVRYQWTADPGFDRAVVPTPAHGNNLRPDARLGPSDVVRVGNNRTHILSIRHDGQSVAAIMCNYRYRLALEHENGKYVSVVHNAPYNQGIDARAFLKDGEHPAQ